MAVLVAEWEYHHENRGTPIIRRGGPAAGAVPAAVVAIAPLSRALPIQQDIRIGGPIQRGNGQFAPGDYPYAA
ncbi:MULTISPECIES: hypothetical protein [Burkholderia]|uniref:Uncharacterized protein n=1 Tax=Burkholderia pyrrocinia TaxID=60550 RepID=A0A318IYZ6_BURPY|nr:MULTISPECIES: hypothetical protein [Burkholderia]PXX36898.1 hypothetical protein NA66_100537 [Burkholderia pyrrocinia]SFW47471.1 hypothetical protein SAMN03159384_02262 [Burkholderia sp. NFACC33-1]SFY03719.1 hypothetical protein SAMN03159408_02984 [Burkholderia sp. NFPP32]